MIFLKLTEPVGVDFHIVGEKIESLMWEATDAKTIVIMDSGSVHYCRETPEAIMRGFFSAMAQLQQQQRGSLTPPINLTKLRTDR